MIAERTILKLLVINNLASGYREGLAYDFVRAFAADGDEITIRTTDGTTDLNTFLHDATSFDAVAVSGGDGTITAVSHRLAYTGVPILPIPAGTGNLLSINLASPNEVHALASQLRDFQIREFDIAEIQVGWNRYGYTLIAGAGYDAAIMKDAQNNKGLLGPMAYFSAALTNLNPQYSKLSISIDGQEPIERKGLGVMVANFSKIQFDVPIAHQTDPQDGLLELIILKSENAFGLLPALGAALLDRGGEFPERSDCIEIIQCKNATVIADPPLQVQYDGDTIEQTTPVSFRVLPKAVRYIVSKEACELYKE